MSFFKKIGFLGIFLFTEVARANISGTYLQNFNPSTDGMCFVTVDCTQTLEPGYVNGGVFFNYAINSLPFFRNPAVISTQKLSEPNNKLFSADFNLGLGIMKGWDAGVSFPFVLSQSVGSSTQLGRYEDTGLTEWKLNTKVRFAGNETWGLAAVAAINFDRISNNPFAGNDPGPTISAELAYDYKLNTDWLLGANLGYRLHDDGSTIAGTGVTPIGDQFIYSTAAAYQYRNWDVTFIGELYGSIPTDDQSLPTDRQPSSLELVLGAKKTFAERWDVHAGIGREVYRGLATPDFRIYAGLNWRIGPLMSRAEAQEPAPIVSRPLPTVPSAEEPPDEVVTLYSINFDTNKTTMTKASEEQFQKNISNIQTKVNDLRHIVVEGHTDNVGSEAHNLKLSQGRAETVLRLLKAGLHLNDAQISAVGKGESRPIASNDSPAGRTKNRRVEIKIYRNK